MIMIFGTLVLNDDISRWFFFFLIFVTFSFFGLSGIKRAKISQNEK